MDKKHFLQEKVTNNEDQEVFIKEVLMYEIIRPVRTEIPSLLNVGRYPEKVRLKEIAGNNISLSESAEYCIVDYYGKSTFNNLKCDESVVLTPIKPYGGTILKLIEQGKYKEPDYSGHFLM